MSELGAKTAAGDDASLSTTRFAQSKYSRFRSKGQPAGGLFYCLSRTAHFEEAQYARRPYAGLRSALALGPSGAKQRLARVRGQPLAASRAFNAGTNATSLGTTVVPRRVTQRCTWAAM